MNVKIEGKIEGLSGALLEFAIGAAAQYQIEWLPYLPPGKTEYTPREIVNAIGQALTAAGIPNNLYREIV